jgi:hypothetical protein
MSKDSMGNAQMFSGNPTPNRMMVIMKNARHQGFYFRAGF